MKAAADPASTQLQSRSSLDIQKLLPLRMDSIQLIRSHLALCSRQNPDGIYYCICLGENSVSRGLNMRRTAKIFMNNRNQAVRLPKEFQFNTREVFIRKEGSDVILSPRPTDWSSYVADGPVASEGFMEVMEDLPVQEREP